MWKRPSGLKTRGVNRSIALSAKRKEEGFVVFTRPLSSPQTTAKASFGCKQNQTMRVPSLEQVESWESGSHCTKHSVARQGRSLGSAVPGPRRKHIPGVWKLMRLISTGSLGWWGARSALFSRHLVRGSESLRLLWRRKRRIGECQHVPTDTDALQARCIRVTGVPRVMCTHVCNYRSSHAPLPPHPCPLLSLLGH